MSHERTCLTTMIGSMPQKTPEEALQVLGKYSLTIPTWTQPPKRAFVEGMVPQYSDRYFPDRTCHA